MNYIINIMKKNIDLLHYIANYVNITFYNLTQKNIDNKNSTYDNDY